MQADTVAALEGVLAKQAAERLIAEYAHGVDNRDLERFMAIWHPEAVWTIAPDIVLDGLDAIRAAIGGVWTAYSETHHWFANLSLIVSGETMHAQSSVNAILREPSGTTFRAAATYVDEFVRSNGEWLIHRRQTTIDLQEPLT